jgi:hypothetical protein
VDGGFIGSHAIRRAPRPRSLAQRPKSAPPKTEENPAGTKKQKEEKCCVEAREENTPRRRVIRFSNRWLYPVFISLSANLGYGTSEYEPHTGIFLHFCRP